MTLSSDHAHDWEHAKENAAPLECGRSTKSLAKRAFGTSTAEMAAVEEKTKKYERLVKRSEKAAEWMQRQAKEVMESEGGADRELTDDEANELRARMVAEIGFDPATPDREHVDYDPLRYWVLYIKHIRESYPSDSQRQFLLMERCARTFTSRPFVAPAYQNDVRFVRTCILYADKTSNPSEVFKMMSKIKVGTKVSLFWVAWAWVAEKAQDFKFTEKIFQKALSVGAEPQEFLEKRQKQFLRRMSRHWLNASQAQEEGLDDEEEEDGGRGALNSLSSTGVARNDRRGGAGTRQAQPQQENGFGRASSRHGQTHGRNESNATAGFAIFQDGGDESIDVFDDENAPGGGRQRMARESERTKENSMRPEQWNERGYGLVNPPGSSAAPPVGGDSIVGTARDFGRPPAHGLPRSNSAAAFDVFVDEEFAADDTNEPQETCEKPADQRSLRQMLDGGTADRLTRNPLRYMKNPSKLESDQIKYDARPDDAGPTAEGEEEKAKAGDKGAQKPAPKERKAGGCAFDKQLVKKDDNGDECCFAERRAMDGHYKKRLVSPDDNFSLLKHDSSTMDVSESITMEESIEDVDMESGTEEIDMERVAAVNSGKPAKSVLKSSLRHGGTVSKARAEEPSSAVNPRRVLFGANTNVVYTNESVNTSTASSQLNGSFVKPEETINTKLANAEISMMFSSPNANASMAETPGKPLLSSSFAAGTSFAIHDEDEPESGGLNFSIHHDNDKIVAKKSARGTKPETGGLAFSIHQDDAKPSLNSGEDTASLSVIGDVMDGIAPGAGNVARKESAPLDFGIYSDPEPISTRNSQQTKVTAEDTATLSVIGDIMGSLENCSVNDKAKAPSGFAIYSEEDPVRPPRKESAGVQIFSDEDEAKGVKSAGLGFEIFSDEVSGSAQKKQKVGSTNEPCFGDISRIEDEKTSNFQILDDGAPTVDRKASPLDAIDYNSQHKQDREGTMRRSMRVAASKSHPRYKIFDYRNKGLPKVLLRNSFTGGTEIDLLNTRCTIVSELGRGVHGVVILCSYEDGQSYALKVQAPIGTLAHEHSLLSRIEDRVEPDGSGFYPFPRPRALYAFSEGGLFSMTAASESGMNLIDVVNCYKKIMGNVPELVAIYYTSRMLKHLEVLHQDGKVLHCDVKPDNWVLTSSPNDEDYAGTNAVEGADLMLVDFGRSIDLEQVAKKGSDPLQKQFKGSIAAEDMECGSMRKGQSWGVDLDFFGLAASSFILLFGSHMDVLEDKRTGKWRLHKSFRRYWQRELWSSLFDTLLNFNSSADAYCLREIRIAFDDYIDGKQRRQEVATHLNQLYTHLPKRR